MIQRCINLTTTHSALAETLYNELTAEGVLRTGNSLFVPIKTQNECDDVGKLVSKYEGVIARNVTLESEYVVCVDNIEGGYDQNILLNLTEDLHKDSCFDEISDAWAACTTLANPAETHKYNTVVLAHRFAIFDEEGRKTELAVYPINYISIL